MKILILAPMGVERDNFKKSLEDYKQTKGELVNQYKVVEIGVGKANAASSTALEIYNNQYDMVVLIGYAAGTPAHSKGDVIVPDITRYHDTIVPEGLVPELTKEYSLDGYDECIVLTGDCFVDKELANKLMSNYGPNIIFDMEASAVAQVCEEANQNLTVIKMISDIPVEDSYESFEDFVNKNKDFTQFVDIIERLK